MDDILWNTEVGIMTTVNELAARFAIKPYQFFARLTREEDGYQLGLSDFAADLTQKQVGQFVETITGDKDRYVLNDDQGRAHLLRGLCKALEVAPKAHSRR